MRNLIIGVLAVFALLTGYKFYQKEQKRLALAAIEQQKRQATERIEQQRQHEELLRQQLQARQKQDFADDEAMVNKLLSEWHDQFNVASSTPRVALPGLMPPLQALLRRVEETTFKSKCLTGPKMQLQTALLLQVNGLLDFLQGNESTAARAIAAGKETLDDFNSSLDKCRTQLTTS